MASNPNPSDREPNFVGDSELNFNVLDPGSDNDSDDHNYVADEDDETSQEEEDDDDSDGGSYDGSDDSEEEEDEDEEEQEGEGEEEEEGDGAEVEEDTKLNTSNVFGISDCPICFNPWTSEGAHRVCCTPCGHLYGRACLDKWLQYRQRKTGKCPQCNGKFKQHQIINIYVPQFDVKTRNPLQVDTGLAIPQSIVGCSDSEVPDLRTLGEELRDLKDRQEVQRREWDERYGELEVIRREMMEQMEEQLRALRDRDEMRQRQWEERFSELEVRLRRQMEEQMAEQQIRWDERVSRMEVWVVGQMEEKIREMKEEAAAKAEIGAAAMKTD